NHENPASILVSRDASMTLIPVEHCLLVKSLSDDVAIDVDNPLIFYIGRNRYRQIVVAHRLPARAGKAVERRMHRVPLALALIIANIEAGIAAAGLIEARDVIVHTQNGQDVGREWFRI